MNVLLLDQFSDPGGAQLVLLDTLAAIREQGWRAVVGMPGEGEMFARVRELGFDAEPISCGPYHSGHKSAGDVGRFMLDVQRLGAQVRRLAASVSADLVYMNGPRIVPGAAWAGLSIPVLFHAHSYLSGGATRAMTGSCLRRMRARVVGSCRFVAEPWVQAVGEERVTVIYNGVAGPASYGRGARDGSMRIGCIGRIAPEKGQLAFVEVARRVAAAGVEARFVIYGAPLFSGGAYEREVRTAAAGLEIEFAGWISDVYAALAEIDVLLVPSAAHEATTRVILEAFAAGVAVIAFASGGIPEVVRDGVNGYLVKDAGEMAAVMRGGELAKLADAARSDWAERFTVARYKREIVACMRVAAGQRLA